MLNKDIFNFCGIPSKYQAISDKNGKSAKEVFYNIDSRGKNIPCFEPELLNQLLLCKGSINFNIKLWADGVWRGLFFPLDIEEIITEYSCPDWVRDAIKKQCEKIIKEKGKCKY